jgi:methyl-accepting chemotaxis protein
LLFRARALQIQAAQSTLENLTGRYAIDLQRRYEAYYGVAAALGQVVNGFKEIDAGTRRDFFTFQLLSILQSNPRYVSVYMVWKPGILDGRDEEFANMPGMDETGNFIPLYTRISGSIELKSYPETARVLANLSSEPFISDPVFQIVNGKQVLITNFELPIIRDEDRAVLGVVGISYNLENSKPVVAAIKPYGVGEATLCSNNGTIIYNVDESRIGQKFQQSVLGDMGEDGVKEVEESIRTGDPRLITYKKNMYQTFPFHIGETENHWILLSLLPQDAVLAQVNTLVVFTILIAAFFIIGMTFIVFLAAGRIVKPIVKVTKTLENISEGEGDLTRTVDVVSNDEIGDLAKYFNATMAKIKDLIGVIKKKSISLHDIGTKLAEHMVQTAAAVNEIAANIQSIKGRVINQSTSVTKTNDIMEQITTNIGKLNSNIDLQTQSVAQSSSAIEEMIANIRSVTTTLMKNAESVKELVNASEVGKGGLQEVADNIQEISRESEGLLEINAVMENIASQTNLLSMNAAIEAAHAGESGKGFAVVADEIRKLAESSSEQSKTISTVLKKIKGSIDKISKSTDAVLNKFDAIDKGMKTVSEQEESIRNAMEEQNDGSKQILDAVARMNEITLQVKEGAQEMLEGSKGVIQEGKNLKIVTEEINSSMNEMATGANQINVSVGEVNTISGENKGNIDVLVGEVSKFKIE